jgi:hypothetical protein
MPFLRTQLSALVPALRAVRPERTSVSGPGRN